MGTKGVIKTKIKASSIENAKKIGAIFSNIAENVEEKDLMNFYEKIKKNKMFLANIIKKLDSPLIRNLIN